MTVNPHIWAFAVFFGWKKISYFSRDVSSYFSSEKIWREIEKNEVTCWKYEEKYEQMYESDLVWKLRKCKRENKRKQIRWQKLKIVWSCICVYDQIPSTWDIRALLPGPTYETLEIQSNAANWLLTYEEQQVSHISHKEIWTSRIKGTPRNRET